MPIVWREFTNYTDDCYCFLSPHIKAGLSIKKRRTVQYPNLSSAIRPISHASSLQLPLHPNIENKVKKKKNTVKEEPNMIST